MTAPAEQAPEVTEAATAPPAESAEQQPKVTETVDYWKQRARQNEAQAKANADAAKRLKEIEDRDLSEFQKAQRDLAEAIAERDRIKSEAEQLRAADLRKQVALEKSLPLSLIGRLQGSTADELAADADALLALMNNPRSPLPDPGQGSRPPAPQDAEAAEFAQHWARMFPTHQQQT